MSDAKALYDAAYRGKAERVRQLIAQGVGVDGHNVRRPLKRRRPARVRPAVDRGCEVRTWPGLTLSDLATFPYPSHLTLPNPT